MIIDWLHAICVPHIRTTHMIGLLNVRVAIDSASLRAHKHSLVDVVYSVKELHCSVTGSIQISSEVPELLVSCKPQSHVEHCVPLKLI